jgi:hypothetical protein
MGRALPSGEPADDVRRLMDLAVRYAAHGWPVVPLHTPRPQGCSCGERGCGSPGKHPRTRRGLHDATTDPNHVRRLWDRWPDANIGVTTGGTSGLVVVDVDLPDGPASLAELEATHGTLPDTCEQRTGSGGRQLLFAHPSGTVGNRTRVVDGIDVRGDGGYIVVPPSRHATGDRYRWTRRIVPADPPGWLLELLARARHPATAPVDVPRTVADLPLPEETRAQRYAAAAMRRELARLAAAVEGTRNDTLNRAAFNLGQLAAAGMIDPDRVAAELQRAATSIGLGPRETRRTIASGLAAGVQHPRSLRPPVDAVAPTPVRHLAARRR